MVIETPEGRDGLTEFLEFHERAYATHPFRWDPPVDLQRGALLGENAFARDREIRAFVARENGEIQARCAAIVDQRYIRHWGESLGHIGLFEALPGALDAARGVLDAASLWLESKGMEAARAGFCALLFDMPYVIDAYDTVPPSMLRHNPRSYHTMIKRAGFQAEQGFVDYRARVGPELLARWQSALESARRSGFEIVPLRELPKDQRIRDFADTFRDTFRAHWGWSPISDGEFEALFGELDAVGVLDTSVLAYQEGAPVGVLFVAADDSAHVKLAPGRALGEAERLNVLGIGVRERTRGRGVNYAMAGYAFQELARRGQTHVSYTLVLDHNWPSRRTGEGLGCEVCANYLAYRRNFRR